MTLAELLTPERIVADMQSDEHWPAIAELVDHLVAIGDLSEELKSCALTALKTREDQRSTGIGGGIGIPHSFLPGLENAVTVFGRSKEGVDFCSLDRAPVHFIVLFMVPPDQHTLHLKTLAAIAKTLNSAETRKQLAAAADENDIFAVLSEKAATV